MQRVESWVSSLVEKRADDLGLYQSVYLSNRIARKEKSLQTKSAINQPARSFKNRVRGRVAESLFLMLHSTLEPVKKTSISTRIDRFFYFPANICSDCSTTSKAERGLAMRR